MSIRSTSHYGILQTALHNFEASAQRLGLDSSIRNKIREPKERTEIRITPVLDGGRMAVCKCFIVRHSDALGPSKGGIRMSADVTLDDITGLAMEMTWKAAVIGVPFGGGKSGIQFDPTGISKNLKEILIRSFTRGALRHIGPEIYVPAPDMGTNEIDMAHIRDCISYSRGTSITDGCYVTGKPVILGGIAGRREATGKGVVYSILALCKRLGLAIARQRIAVQGFGNVGSVVVAELAHRGATVVGVSDVLACVTEPDGLDIAALRQHVQDTGSVAGFPKSRSSNRDQLFETECDIFIPAAGESQITESVAPEIKARIVAEGANAPTTPGADRILNDRKIHVIPDILCNAGGVFVSYLEYTQETQREQMTLDEVDKRLSERMTERFDEIYEQSMQTSQMMRETAMDVGLGRVAEAVHSRGLLP